MKNALLLLMVLHGGIHLMGFVKAFQLAEINQLSQSIGKPSGLLWLLTTLLFVVGAILLFLKKDWWPIVAIIAVILSQILIILVWKDAKFGTIANIIILLMGISANGNFQFDKMVRMESKQLLENIKIDNLPIVTKEDANHLPEIVQKWLQNSGVIGKEKIVSVRLQQKGEMKTKPESKWMPFTATQYFNVQNPAFVWSTEVDFVSMVNMVGRDKFMRGEGEMLIKLANVIPVVNEGNNDKINQGAMVRYMAEMVWFPSAALSDYIKWEPIDTNAAKATFILNGKMVSGIYTFSDEGNFKSFEADRYYGGKKDSKLEKWKIIASDYKEFNGIRIPNKCSVTWKLKEGDFNWLNLEITAWEYNTTEQYE